MSNPAKFVDTWTITLSQLVGTLQQLRTMNDQLTQDPTLITRYFDVTKNPTPRTDIVAQDITNAESAITQLLFAFDSGAPTQKSFIFKMLA